MVKENYKYRNKKEIRHIQDMEREGGRERERERENLN
jgi:hypothetical protein